MKTILTYGTFDLLHVGHVRLLRRARAMGDRLIVGLSTDDFNLLKGKKSFYSFIRRLEILKAIRYVTIIIPENSWEQKERDIKRYSASVLVQTTDWRGKFDHLRSLCKVIYLPRTKGISTTLIKSAFISNAHKPN
jgi:glycerol-3-phosphate cytidylyltransferase